MVTATRRPPALDSTKLPSGFTETVKLKVHRYGETSETYNKRAEWDESVMALIVEWEGADFRFEGDCRFCGRSDGDCQVYHDTLAIFQDPQQQAEYYAGNTDAINGKRSKVGRHTEAMEKVGCAIGDVPEKWEGHYFVVQNLAVPYGDPDPITGKKKNRYYRLPTKHIGTAFTQPEKLRVNDRNRFATDGINIETGAAPELPSGEILKELAAAWNGVAQTGETSAFTKLPGNLKKGEYASLAAKKKLGAMLETEGLGVISEGVFIAGED